MDEPPQDEDDAALVRRIAEGRDAAALATLLARHVPKVTGHLRRRFRHQLQHPDIDEAVNRAALSVWQHAADFDPSKRFGPWFMTIAQNAALNILRGENRRPTSELILDPPDHDPDRFADPSGVSAEVEWHVEQLDQIIERELKGFEQAVARADVAAGGRADTELLMRQHGKTKGVVQATRSKVWKKVREKVAERKALRDRTKGNP